MMAGTIQSPGRQLAILLSTFLALIGLVLLSTVARSSSNEIEFHSELCGTLSGVINNNTVLVEDCTYDVTGNVLVEATAVMTINPGVTLNFTDAYFIHVLGSLNALGKSDKRVLITSSKSDYSSSNPQIRLLGNERSIISHVKMEPKGNGEWVVVSIRALNGPHLLENISVESPDFRKPIRGGGVQLGHNQTIQNSLFSNISGVIIKLVNDSSLGQTKILSNTFSWNDGHTLDSGLIGGPEAGDSLIFSNNRVLHNKSARVDFQGRNVTVTNNLFVNNYSLDDMNFFEAGESETDVAGSFLIECNLFKGTKFRRPNSTNPRAQFLLSDLVNSSYTFRNNNLYQASGGVTTFIGSPPPPTMTVENNYWGTVDASQIDTMIWDYNDDFFRALVDYRPFLDNPAPCAPVERSLILYLPFVQNQDR